MKNREMQIKICDTVRMGVDTVKESDDTVNDTVKQSDDTVLSLIKGNVAITAGEIATQLGFSLATIKRKVKMLKDCGIIVRVGSDKTGSWKVLQGVENE